MRINCLIVDDEPLAIKVIESHSHQISQLKVVARCNSALDALEVLRTENIDLVFLDIQMPGLSGLEMIQSLNRPPAVIFTTAHRDYAVDSYDVNAVDYLLKPISFPRFLQAVNRYFEGQTSGKSTQEGSNAIPAIHLRADRKTYKVDVGNILYVEGLKDYVKVHLENEKPLITKEKMSDMENQLANAGFLRTHKSFLVQKNKITSFNSESVDIGECEVPIGRTYRDVVLEELGKLQ